MSNELLRGRPADQDAMLAFVRNLHNEFKQMGIQLRVDPDFGKARTDRIAFNVDNERTGINQGFFVFLFDPSGLLIAVPQNSLGLKTLTAFCEATHIDPDTIDPEPITREYAMFVTLFEYMDSID